MTHCLVEFKRRVNALLSQHLGEDVFLRSLRVLFADEISRPAILFAIVEHVFAEVMRDAWSSQPLFCDDETQISLRASFWPVGASIAPHSHDHWSATAILYGHLRFRVYRSEAGRPVLDREFVGGRGDTGTAPAGTIHSVEAVGNALALHLFSGPRLRRPGSSLESHRRGHTEFLLPGERRSPITLGDAIMCCVDALNACADQSGARKILRRMRDGDGVRSRQGTMVARSVRELQSRFTDDARRRGKSGIPPCVPVLPARISVAATREQALLNLYLDARLCRDIRLGVDVELDRWNLNESEKQVLRHFVVQNADALDKFWKRLLGKKISALGTTFYLTRKRVGEETWRSVCSQLAFNESLAALDDHGVVARRIVSCCPSFGGLLTELIDLDLIIDQLTDRFPQPACGPLCASARYQLSDRASLRHWKSSPAALMRWVESGGMDRPSLTGTWAWIYRTPQTGIGILSLSVGFATICRQFERPTTVAEACQKSGIALNETGPYIEGLTKIYGLGFIGPEASP